MCLGVQSVINHTAMTVSPGCDGQVDIPRPAPPSPYPLPPSCHCPPSIKNSAPPLDYITHPAETAMTYFLFRQFGLCLFGRDERLCLSLCFSLSLRTPLPISVCLCVSSYFLHVWFSASVDLCLSVSMLSSLSFPVSSSLSP